MSVKFSKSHEWLKVENDIAVVGITDYAQKELGDVVFVELPSMGDSFQKQAQCATIESTKAASEVYCPCSGEVVEVNNDLEQSPELINQSPEEKGWIFKIKLSDLAELDSLLDKQAYDDFVSREAH